MNPGEVPSVSWPLDKKFLTAGNEAIVAFIRRRQPSAHSDVASILTESAKGLAGVRWYCPDVHRYAYVVLHSGDNTIFGIAYGMQSLAFRLPPALILEAVTGGGTVDAEIGDEWVLFPPWGRARPGGDLARWCKVAYHYAVEGALPSRG
jgi:GMP synthase-like glutamine amidotransferase